MASPQPRRLALQPEDRSCRDESAVLPSARRQTGSVEAICPSKITAPEMSECSEMSRGRILARSTESALDDDNLLAEFLLRLPPLPSSLPRASLVCKRWRRLISEPHFLQRFRSHHGNAPLLGLIYQYYDVRNSRIGFISAVDSPNHIRGFNSLSLIPPTRCKILDSHHGLVLILDVCTESVHVWDPVIEVEYDVALPEALHDMSVVAGVVLCAIQDQGHEHGTCHSYPFKIVLVTYESDDSFCFSVYSSETGAWGDTISWPFLRGNITTRSVLIGNSVCWLFGMEKVKILQFDLNEQNLALIDVPSHVSNSDDYIYELSIMPMDSGAINLIVLEGCTATVRVWKCMSNGTADASWMLGNTLELSNILSLRPSGDGILVVMLASDEDGNVMFKLADGVVVLFHLGTMQFRKLAEKMGNSRRCQYYPFTSFYTPGI